MIGAYAMDTYCHGINGVATVARPSPALRPANARLVHNPVWSDVTARSRPDWTLAEACPDTMDKTTGLAAAADSSE